MTTNFATRLAALGLTQARLRRWIERTTGRKVAASTTSRWASGDRHPGPEVDALLSVAERHPSVLREMKGA